jgi:predicted nucleic-acid-binding protein
VEAFELVLRTKELIVEQAEIVWKAVRAFKSSHADFADCLIAQSAASAGCERTATFDRSAAKTAGMTRLAASAF